MRSLNLSRSDLRTIDKKKSRKLKALLKGLDRTKLKGVVLKSKKIQRKDPALGSGDSAWANEWDKLGNYGSSPIKHLVILSF